MQKKSVFKNRDLVTPHYMPDKLPFRENQIKQMTNVLALALKGSKPDNIFIYGRTGTGKTVTTKFVLNQLNEFASKTNAKIVTTYINCRNHPTKYKVLLKCCSQYYPEHNFIGYSAGFVYEKVVSYVEKNECFAIIALDEIDKVKDLDDLIYALTRSNDEISKGGISIIGISNNVLFKDRLDARTKSSLCQQELVFPPYNAYELKEILKQRVELAFNENAVQESAINLAAAIAAKESGDARTAVMLLLRAGEIADQKGLSVVTDKEVEEARKKVEEEIILNMISTLPIQEQLVLLAITKLSLNKRGINKLTGMQEENVLYSGEVYEEYCRIARSLKENVVSARWYREYIHELETYGLIVTTASGAGQRGQTTFIKLGYEAQKIYSSLSKILQAENI